MNSVPTIFWVQGRPTTIDARTWSCLSQAEPQPGQGAGALGMAWFRQHNN